MDLEDIDISTVDRRPVWPDVGADEW
jgi:hypothetical protein